MIRMAVVKSPKRQKREDAAKKREEERWAKRSGPVTTRIATPEELARYRKK